MQARLSRQPGRRQGPWRKRRHGRAASAATLRLACFMARCDTLHAAQHAQQEAGGGAGRSPVEQQRPTAYRLHALQLGVGRQ